MQVKNDKGLWVKSSKLSDAAVSSALKPSGRGGGVPVLKALAGLRAEEASPSSGGGTDHSLAVEHSLRKRTRVEYFDGGDEHGHRGHHRRPRSRSPEVDSSRVHHSRIDSDIPSTDQQTGNTATEVAFNAVQVVNRFLEIFSESGSSIEKKYKLIAELFSDSVNVYTLKTRKILLSSKSALLDSFKKVSFHAAFASRRVFIECSTKSNSDPVSFCLDFHRPLSSPGMGDPSKDGCLLYRCQNSQITHVWGGVDKELLASLTTLTFPRVKCSEVWRQAVAVMSSEFDCSDDANMHFHDYTNIEIIE